MRKKRMKKSNLILIISLTLLLLILCALFIIFNRKNIFASNDLNKNNMFAEMKEKYSESVITNKESELYSQDGKVLGKVSANMNIELDEYKENDLGLFKLKYSNYYIKYDVLSKVDSILYDTRYKRYIPFNENVIVNNNTKLYVDTDKYYVVNEEINSPIIIKNENKYYVEFDNKLVYVNADEVETVNNVNSEDELAESLAVLNYHFVINAQAGEDKICDPSSICLFDTEFDNHMRYISENNIFSITMKELEMFIDGEINLPKKSVAITIDDGWFVGRSIPILEKYNVMGTLFLIGNLAPVSDYASSNLEVHSHTWNLHNVSNCSTGRSPLLCYDKEMVIADLKKSRESLNDTTYFCYPFYEYNDYTIECLKEAGFTMALTGGNKKVTKGINKYKVPRYVIYNTTTVADISNMIN